jgi:hypothetical protein
VFKSGDTYKRMRKSSSRRFEKEDGATCSRPPLKRRSRQMAAKTKTGAAVVGTTHSRGEGP